MNDFSKLLDAGYELTFFVISQIVPSNVIV